jgi:hypothetical protein
MAPFMFGNPWGIASPSVGADMSRHELDELSEVRRDHQFYWVCFRICVSLTPK